jgi:hypothetical protein
MVVAYGKKRTDVSWLLFFIFGMRRGGRRLQQWRALTVDTHGP